MRQLCRLINWTIWYLLEKKQTKEKNKMSIQKELNQANKQVAITKDNLINDIDVFFYDIENKK